MDKKELRKEILQRLYEKGYRYIARDLKPLLYVYKEKPYKYYDLWNSEDPSMLPFDAFNDLFQDVKFEDKEPFDIEKELGIVDWSTIPKDTKVLVSRDGEFWTNRYFKEYRKNSAQPFVVYADGVTSWSAAYDGNIAKFEYCKLVTEGNNESTF
ncbi:hypothetical protein HMPREF0872_04005 [Veillonella montpellierensis DNF00314]|uniref:Uncharacterized protein n=2 Tax=Veillonella montpellierensis TaxID=187328 RepID=A0A096AL58_9FIRM|nr:hypothetical protein HMPREF0872_04005 [Veillonella montpellierensis DNF00314]